MSGKREFGHYEILEDLGRGGMGIVYKAMDKALDRLVALKVMSAELRADETQIKRFMQEAKATAQLHHPNIILVYEVGETPEPYFAMEYVEGETLAQWIEAQRGGLKETVDILSKICDAVECAHRKNIIHRDLKPSNIMITKDNQLKVMDFGLAKFLDAPLKLSKPGEPVGTTYYMSPEQACGEEVDERTDIYSLGVVFYEMLVGKPPFQGTSALSVLQHIVKTPPTSPCHFKSDIPKEMAEICLKCLAKKPEDRYQKVGTLKRELEKLFSSQADTAIVKARTLQDQMPLAAGKKNSASRVVRLAIFFTLFFLISLAATLFFWRPSFFNFGLFRTRDASSQPQPVVLTPSTPTTPTVPPTPTTPTVPPPAEKIVVVAFHSSNTKQDWVDAVVRQFNGEKHKTTDGSVISVKVEHVGSGSSMDSILQGKTKPTAWSPGSSPWVEQINQAWLDRTGKKIITAPSHPTTREPLVIAMWEPMARALGWPDKPLGWRDIAALSSSPQGWASVGHPEWGNFKFGHGHPDYSNSGLLSVIAETYASAGVKTGLTVDLVKSKAVIANMAAVEQRVYHYGRLDTDLLSKMTERGPAYLHAVATYEVNVIKWNMEHAKKLQFPFVAIYPADGTFWVENPYCLLDADWIKPGEREAAEIFGKYLLHPERQARAIAFALRPADRSVALTSPIDMVYGALPAITMDKVPDLEYPTKEVVGHIGDVFHRVKKKTMIVLVLDTSGSMEGEKIRSATKGAVAFLDLMGSNDRILVYTFSDKVTELQPLDAVGKVREKLRKTLQGLYAEGGTALHEVMICALDKVAAEQKSGAITGKNRRYAIVLLSDGKNDVEGGPSKNDLLSKLPSGEQSGNLTIYTIAYGEDADKDLLAALARRTNGKVFTGDPSNIKNVYSLIASEF
jgi:Ca-activated chloride channel family protein